MNTASGDTSTTIPIKRVAVIGAGIAGLSAGCYLQMNGYGQTINRLGFRIHNYDPTMAPPGKTAITSMIPIDYDYWNELARDRTAYEAEKKAVADSVVKVLESRFPGAADRVEVVDVATPITFERYTGNWRGSFEGWQPTPATLTLEMPKTLPGLRGFYLAGQWVAPGGGLPSGVMTGRQVTQLVCHEDGRKFRTTLP